MQAGTLPSLTPKPSCARCLICDAAFASSVSATTRVEKWRGVTADGAGGGNPADKAELVWNPAAGLWVVRLNQPCSEASGTMTEENMHTFRVAFVCAFAGALMACNVASLHAAPLPTNVAAMKSMVADSSIQVRWGGWGYRGFGGWGHRGWGWGPVC